MEWIHYSLANRYRFHTSVRLALDALNDHFGLVGVRPPTFTDGSTWEIEVSARDDDPFSYSMSGRSLAEVAHKLAAWKGIEIPIRQV